MHIERLDEKCTQCFLCVRDCVSGVWRVNNGVPVAAAPELCNLCSHCIAVCPADAIIHSKLDSVQAVTINRKRLDPTVYREIVLSRRSIRNFTKKTVPGSIIDDIINTARYSPTASNDQNVGYTVITDKKRIEKTAQSIYGFTRRLYDVSQRWPLKALLRITGLSGNRYLKLMEYIQQETVKSGRDFILHNAPVLILVHGPRKKRFAHENCVVAATNIMNYSHALGLGTCYIGLLCLALKFSKRLRNTLGVPKNRTVYAGIVMGYPAYKHVKTASRKKTDITWISG